MNDFTADPLNRLARERLGTSLCGRYRLRRLIGIGGMAAVYAGVHRNGNAVAIKVLHARLASDPQVDRLFRREALLANLIGHPAVVPILDDDVAEDGSVFLVMPRLEGETLRARVERHEGRKLPVEEVVVIAHVMLGALAAAHAKKVVHRDVKPENIFVTTSGEVKVLDFGIGRFFETNDPTTATRSGNAVGTPAFMAPEQALGRLRSMDGRTDLWALGATMFTLLSGRYVHEAESGTEVAIMAATRPARRLSAVAPEIPAALAEVVDRALEFEREARWGDAEEMDRALLRATEAVFGKSVDDLPPIAVAQREEGGTPLEEVPEGEGAGVMQPLGAGPPRNEPLRSAPTGERQRFRSPAAPLGPRGLRRRHIALAGLLAFGLVGTGVLLRARMHAAREATRTIQPPPALEVSSTSPLGCPIFEVTGLSEFQTWIGAAASTLACGRAKWYLGGRDDRVFPPAALLGAPVQPTVDPPALYATPGQREHTLSLVKERGLRFAGWPRYTWTAIRGRPSRTASFRAPDGREDCARQERKRGQ